MTTPETILSSHGYEWWELDTPDERTRDFIASLYVDEPEPIFEHNWVHILTYLKFESKLYAVSAPDARFILVVREGTIALFTPRFDDISALQKFGKAFSLTELSILNVSRHWKERHGATLPSAIFTPRSQEEVIYDLSLLTRLEGGDFEKLRSVRNKLLRKNILTFVAATKENVEKVLTVWQSVQGGKYSKDKHAKELFVTNEILRFENKDVHVEVGMIDGKELSVMVYFPSPTHPDYGICYMVKGLNRASEGGVHGVSDASYVHVFEKLHSEGVLYLNDGEVGCEEGTRTHKHNFKPIRSLQSFDVIIEL